MKNTASIRLIVAMLLIGTFVFTPCAAKLRAQAPESGIQTLLDRAHALELRGRIDIAAQDWQQVLLIDPNNIDALAGLARSAKFSGNPALANVYLDRIKAIDPHAAQQITSLSMRPRPTVTPSSRVAQHHPPVQSNSVIRPLTQTQASIAVPTQPTPENHVSKSPDSQAALAQQAKSPTPPSATPPQPETYGPYVAYVPPIPLVQKVVPPQTEVAVVPPLSCRVIKTQAVRTIPPRTRPSVARQQVPQPTSFSYGQQYPQPRPIPRSKPVSHIPAAPTSILPLPCEPTGLTPPVPGPPGS